MWWADGANDYWHWPFMFGPMMVSLFVLFMTMMGFMMRAATQQRPRESRVMELLKERYVRGEINQAEYDERRRRIEN